MPEIIRIVPMHAGEGEAALTMGTKVFAGDTEIAGITKIELIANVEDVWRAVIHVVPEPFEVQCLADTKRHYFAPILGRIKNWWNGYRTVP